MVLHNRQNPALCSSLGLADYCLWSNTTELSQVGIPLSIARNEQYTHIFQYFTNWWSFWLRHLVSIVWICLEFDKVIFLFYWHEHLKSCLKRNKIFKHLKIYSPQSTSHISPLCICSTIHVTAYSWSSFSEELHIIYLKCIRDSRFLHYRHFFDHMKSCTKKFKIQEHSFCNCLFWLSRAVCPCFNIWSY